MDSIYNSVRTNLEGRLEKLFKFKEELLRYHENQQLGRSNIDRILKVIVFHKTNWEV